MLHSLPAETVFEAKEKARRETRVLFVVLLVAYGVFFNIFAVGFCLMFGAMGLVFLALGSPELLVRLDHVLGHPEFLLRFFTATNLTGVLLGLLHFRAARRKPLYSILAQLKAQPVDPEDEYHSRFANIVGEIEAVTGVQPIRPVVLSTTGLNAFSVQDGQGNAAIGVTEGLLAKLDRAQVEAVLAHEGAHLVHEDSRVTTTACSLTAVFDPVRSWFSRGVNRVGEGLAGAAGERAAARAHVGVAQALPLWLISVVSHLVTTAVSTGISRSRELLADAHAVDMCKNPLALAEALYRISRGYRGNLDVEPGLAPLFILNPGLCRADEQDGILANLFCTHPPVSERLDKLLDWARSDLYGLRKSRKKPLDTAGPGREKEEAGQFYALHKDSWHGPHAPAQLLALGLVAPQTWISADGQTEFLHACEHPTFLALFQRQVPRKGGRGRCPRCRVSLLESRYEGAPVFACSFCHGHLLRPGVLERIVSRQEREFSKEEVERARFWRSAQGDYDPMVFEFPDIKCPLCRAPTDRMFHSTLTRVVIDRCMDPACRAIWCDGGELDRIQILIEAACGKRVVSEVT